MVRTCLALAAKSRYRGWYGNDPFSVRGEEENDLAQPEN